MTGHIRVYEKQTINKVKKFSRGFDLTSVLTQQKAMHQTKIKYDEVIRENYFICPTNINDNNQS